MARKSRDGQKPRASSIRNRTVSAAAPAVSRSRARAAVALATVGVALAGWLVWIHLALKSEPGAGSACDLGGYFDCDVVNGSRYASVVGIPIAYGALAMYALLGALAVAELRGTRTARLGAYSRWLGTMAAVYSLYLAFVSTVVLKALCVFCVALYVVNIGFAVLGWLEPRSQRGFMELLGSDVRLLLRGAHAWPARIAVLLLVLGAVVTRSVGQSRDERGIEAPATVDIKSAQISVLPGHGEGPADAPVVVIEFSDFDCPRCGEASATLEQLRRRFAGRVRFVFKHFPLNRECNRRVGGNKHQGACAAAEAAVCAGDQGRLWEFQKAVFAHGTGDDALRSAADAAGLDRAAWNQCRWTERARKAVVGDVEDGLRLNVTRTPTFLVDDRLIRGAGYEQMLTEAIERKLAQAGPS